MSKVPFPQVAWMGEGLDKTILFFYLKYDNINYKT